LRLAAIAPCAHEVVALPGGGHLLLAQLSLEGWFVHVTASLAGDGLVVVAEHPLFGRVVSRVAGSAAEVAVEIFEEALVLSGRGDPLH
jgi:hypothetical protein